MGIPSDPARCSSGPSTKAWTKVLKFSSGHTPMPGRGSCLKEFSSMPCARWRDGKLMKNHEKPWKNHEKPIIFSSRIWEWWGFTGKNIRIEASHKIWGFEVCNRNMSSKTNWTPQKCGDLPSLSERCFFSSATYGCQEYVTCWCAT